MKTKHSRNASMAAPLALDGCPPCGKIDIEVSASVGRRLRSEDAACVHVLRVPSRRHDRVRLHQPSAVTPPRVPVARKLHWTTSGSTTASLWHLSGTAPRHDDRAAGRCRSDAVVIHAGPADIILREDSHG